MTGLLSTENTFLCLLTNGEHLMDSSLAWPDFCLLILAGLFTVYLKLVMQPGIINHTVFAHLARGELAPRLSQSFVFSFHGFLAFGLLRQGLKDTKYSVI